MQVTAVVVRCDLVSCEEHTDVDRSPCFAVTASARLADGREVLWRTGRGFSAWSLGFGADFSDPWAHLDVSRLEEDARQSAVGDSEAEIAGDRLELARVLRAHGVLTSPDELVDLPVEVRLSGRVRDRLAGGDATS